MAVWSIRMIFCESNGKWSVAVDSNCLCWLKHCNHYRLEKDINANIKDSPPRAMFEFNANTTDNQFRIDNFNKSSFQIGPFYPQH